MQLHAFRYFLPLEANMTSQILNAIEDVDKKASDEISSLRNRLKTALTKGKSPPDGTGSDKT